jgi:hypothetical protein
LSLSLHKISVMVLGMRLKTVLRRTFHLQCAPTAVFGSGWNSCACPNVSGSCVVAREIKPSNTTVRRQSVHSGC